MKNNNKLIGISGKIKSGKDFSAKLIILIYEYYKVSKDFSIPLEIFIDKMLKNKYFDYNLFWNRISFGDSLKEIVSKLSGCNCADLYSHEFKNSNSSIINLSTNSFYTYRELLQLVGSSLRKTLGDNIWINSTFKKAVKEKTIIPDVRYLNEAQAIKDKGGILIRINRDVSLDTHISETELDNYQQFNYIIYNNRDINYLINELVTIMKKEEII